MDEHKVARMWTATATVQWPPAPERMSVSTIRQIETCSKRWALDSADYPDIWDRHGYPSRPSLPAVKGLVAHRALATILRHLAAASCPSVDCGTAVGVMRKIGGCTKVIDDAMCELLDEYRNNPRAAPRVDRMYRHLFSQIPHLRRLIKLLLNRIHIERGDLPIAVDKGFARRRTS